ncbi:MAG: type II toxin-antitoxin system YafQ family toxin [Rickettsiales bacterium]|nr:MAG: type II toxin-antitoxin system YafQ family toxin [Rickettsiales bacterium]
MLNLYKEKTFKKDIKKFKDNENIKNILNDVVLTLLNEKKLETKYKNHKLVGNKKDYLECHILPDLVLVYQITQNDLKLNRLCNHSELLKK